MRRRLFNLLVIASLLVLVFDVAVWIRGYFAGDQIVFAVSRDRKSHSRIVLEIGRGTQTWTYAKWYDLPHEVERWNWEPRRGWPWGWAESNASASARTGYTSPVPGVAWFRDAWTDSFDGTNAWSTRQWYLLFHNGWLLAIASVLPFIWFGRWQRERRRQRIGLCDRCGYDLRATPERCPECGNVAAALISGKSD